MRRNGQRAGPLHEHLRQVEKEAIEAALMRNHGNVTAAAEELGRHRVGLWQRMRTLGIERPPFQRSLAVACPRCGVPAGESCRHPGVAHRRRAPHAERSVFVMPEDPNGARRWPLAALAWACEELQRND